MMSNKFLIVALFFLTVVSTQIKAQDFYASNEDCAKKNKAFVVHSVNLTVGAYMPEMDAWNDTYFPNINSSEELGLNLVFGGNIIFGVGSEFRIRAGVSYWSDEVEDKVLGPKKLEISFTRYSLGAFYAPEFARFASFGESWQMYCGFEAYHYDVDNTIIRSDMNENDISFAPVIGIDKVFNEHMLIGAEFSYMIGNYNQSGIVASQTQEVSISGPQFSLSIGYKF